MLGGGICPIVNRRGGNDCRYGGNRRTWRRTDGGNGTQTVIPSRFHCTQSGRPSDTTPNLGGIAGVRSIRASATQD